MMNPMQMMQQFNNFRQQMLQKNPNMNPQEMVTQMMQNGQISQTQFEQARKFAEMFGVKF